MRAKVETTKLGPWLTETARDMRERLAAETFTPERVREACTTAALEGYSAAVVKPSAPLNLRETEAVKTLEIWLAKEGLRSNWNLGRDGPEQPEHWQLSITW